jgi:outer membrane protein TolC
LPDTFSSPDQEFGNFMASAMRQQGFLCLLILFILLCSRAYAGSEGQLTLKDAVELALSSNPVIEQTQARVTQARAAIHESRAAFFPHIDVYLEYLRGDAPSAYLFKTIDARRLPPQTDFNDPGRFDNFETGARARLNLYAGGSHSLNESRAEQGLKQALSGQEAATNELVAAVVDTYLAMLSAADAIDIAEQSVSLVEREIQSAQVRYEGGSLLRADLLSLEVRKAQALEQVITAQTAHKNLQAALRNLLDMEATAPLEPVSGELGYSPPESFGKALQTALDRRPELISAAAEVESAHLQQKIARAEYLPRLDVEARLYHDDPHPSYNDDQLNWTLGANLSWEVFSGFATRARVQRAEGRSAESRATKRRLRRQIELEVHQAWLELQQARARTEVTQAAVSQAVEAYQIVQTRFSGGAAEITRYLEAELALNRSRLQALSAQRDQQRAAADLARAMGLWAQPELRDNLTR